VATLNELDYRLVPWAKWLLEVGRYYDPRLVVTSGFRDMAKQKTLHDRWLRGESRIPAASPGRSLHNYGLAFDLARLGVDPFRDPLLEWLGSLWSHVGGVYGQAADPVHFAVRASTLR